MPDGQFNWQAFTGGVVIVSGGGKNSGASNAILSLIFAEGTRPSVEALTRLAGRDDGLVRFTISHEPAPFAGWVELLATGLTFDCSGLAPGAAASVPPLGALLGLAEPPPGEALALAPAPHLADGVGMLPVIRFIAGLGAELASLPGVKAAVWNPARCWMAPDYYRKFVSAWLRGGAFPALGLTSLQREIDGAMVTVGLALITGQELRFEPHSGMPPAGVARIAVRLIHALIETGPLTAPYEFTGPEDETLDVVPIQQGRQLRVSVRQ